MKVKLAPVKNATTLQHELEMLRRLTKTSKYFVLPYHDTLIPSTEFTVTDSTTTGPKDPRFNSHLAMVIEMGEITLSDFLRRNHQIVSQTKLIDIISCLVYMVLDAHALDLVLMDIKDANVMHFKMGPGLYSWKGIDLESCLEKDAVLSKSRFMATIPFMAPELLTGAETRAQLSMDIWSLGMLIFNTLICKQRQTFWTLQGINSDAAIKEEIVKGRLTQTKVDELIARTFSGSDNSSQRHFLERMLKIDPNERWTITALEQAALMKGSSSISPSILVEGQHRILSAVQSLSDKVTVINMLATPTDIKDLLANLAGSNLAADRKKADELRVIDACPPALQYYVTMQVSMNGFLQACTVLSSEMVANNKRGVAGSIAAAVGVFSSLASPVPFASFGLEVLKAALTKIDVHVQLLAVEKVVAIFRGDSTAISLVAEGVARGMALHRKADLERIQLQLQVKKGGPVEGAFRMAVDFCLNKTDSDASKDRATADAQTVMQNMLSGDLAFTSSGGLSRATNNERRAESITGEILTFLQAKKA